MKCVPIVGLTSNFKSIISEQIRFPLCHQHNLSSHHECEIIWIQEGSGILIAGNCLHSFSHGDVFFLGANIPHLFKSDPIYNVKDDTNKANAYSVYFNPEGNMKSLFALPEMISIQTFLRKHRYGFRVPALSSGDITGKIIDIHSSSDIELLNKFLDLLNSFRQIKEIEPLFPPENIEAIGTDGGRLRSVLDFVLENYKKQITLKQVAGIAHMTPQAFCRYFKKQTGLKFVSFLNELRVNQACRSLIVERNTDRISEAAYSAGFNSINNFNRIFKNITGCSPKAYVNSNT
jgi:AraC-like DNA-binding protein